MSCRWRMFSFANDADYCVFQPPGWRQKVTRVEYCLRVRLLRWYMTWPRSLTSFYGRFFCWPLVTSSCLLLFVGCELGIRNPLEVEVAQKKYVYIKSISSPTLLTRFWSNLLYDIYLWKNVPSPGSISTAPLPHTFCPPSGTSVPRKWKKNYMISI